jgi:hypothetical protein
MISNLTSLPLAFLDLQPWSITLIIPIASMILVGVIIVTMMYFGHRRQELWHQTARIALEKGQPLPPLPDGVGLGDATSATGAANSQPRWRGYLIGGLINVAIGAGLFVSLSQISGTPFNVGYLGCIPGFIGIALLLGAGIEAFASRNK